MKQKTIFETNTGLQFANKEMAELAEKIQRKLWADFDVDADLKQDVVNEFFLVLDTWREVEHISVVDQEEAKVFLIIRDNDLTLNTDYILTAYKKGLYVELDRGTLYVSFEQSENALTPKDQFFWFLENSGSIFKEED